jgi:hypothetical protein
MILLCQMERNSTYGIKTSKAEEHSGDNKIGN